MNLTEIEKQVWITAFTRNQPQPGNVNDESIYWAACVVHKLRGQNHPTPQEIKNMFS
jgi:hypothetical protein